MNSKKKITAVTFWLVLIGVVYIYNSTVIHSQNVFGSPHKFFFLHLSWVIIGSILFFIFSRVDYKKLIAISPILYIGTLVFLIFLAISGMLPCTLSSGFAPCVNSANRWFYINPTPLPKIPLIGELGFQPSEVAKLVLIVFLAFKLPETLKKSDKNKPFLAYLLYTSIFAGLVLLQPNMSTALILFAIGSVMYIASGATLKPILIMVPVVLLLAFFFVILSPYRRERLVTYLGGNITTATNTVSRDLQEDYQFKQVQIALGSGGFFGVGFGKSRQKYTYLPEVASDSMFAVIGEEFGFLGTTAVVVIFFLLVFRGLEAGRKCANPSGNLAATGISAWIGLQFLIHLMANSGLIPYTGVPLPLISYGGSSFVFTMVALGVLVNIAQ